MAFQEAFHNCSTTTGTPHAAMWKTEARRPPDQRLVEEGAGDLAMGAHADVLVRLPRLTKEPAGAFAISRGGAIQEHQGVEAAYLRLFETVGHGLGLAQRRLKVLLRGVPLACRRRGHPRHRLREAEGPQRYRSRRDQLPSQRIQLPSLRILAED